MTETIKILIAEDDATPISAGIPRWNSVTVFVTTA